MLFRLPRILILAATALLGVAALPAQPMLRVRADHWMPYNGTAADERPGYVVEILRAIFEPQEVQVNYALLPWDESLAEARAGRIEAVIGANATEAADLVVPKESIGVPRVGIWVRKGSVWSYANAASLQTIRLGCIHGYSYSDPLDAYLRTAKPGAVTAFAGENPLQDGIAKLSSGEIDAFIETVPVFIWAVKASGRTVSDFRIEYSEIAEPVYIAFARTELGRRRAAAFDVGIRKLRTSGALATILRRYGLSDWQ